MRISVIGCGYLGAVHAAAMAEQGHEVVGVDVVEARIAVLSSGRAPFFEPGLDALVASGVSSGRLTFTTEFSKVAGARLHFLTVGTPQKEGADSADLTYVDAAVESLLPWLRPGDLVVGKSTVPVGTAARLSAVVHEGAPGTSLAWNPEFLREGFAVQDTLAPDRLVYGVAVDDDSSTALLDEAYATVLERDTPRIVTDLATAELVKVSANAFLATKISFINAMAEIAEATGADVTQLADAIGHDARIGRRFLNAGVGFGGGCLPKDIRAFRARAEELGIGQSLAFLAEVDSINLRRRDRVVELARDVLGGSVAGKRITVLGLAFKPDSDDIRDSPALDIATRLAAEGAIVTCTDPEAVENARRRAPSLAYAATAEEAATGSELVVLLTEWRQYRELDPAAFGSVVAERTIIDGRNCLDPVRWREAGWQYRSLGRP
jgi:UDPglucose 6-dehydrogenase